MEWGDLSSYGDPRASFNNIAVPSLQALGLSTHSDFRLRKEKTFAKNKGKIETALPIVRVRRKEGKTHYDWTLSICFSVASFFSALEQG